MMERFKRTIALLLAILLLQGILPISVFAEESETAANTVTISTPEEFLTFSEMCRYDAYSDGLTVVLANDIDMTGHDFQDIPIFLGKFDGGGYTVRGIDQNLEMDNQGLFRYVAEGATVSNLTVLASVEATYNTIGGIACENLGTIVNCNFRGSVTGMDTVGAIAAINYGTISGCISSGYVLGETQVGGIVGVNQGTILRCYNYAQVNTDISSFEFTTEERLISNMDPNSDTIDIAYIGGIAGFSDGAVKNCVNHSTVGYPHVGYNIGGIVGMQSGYLSDCTNNGLVQGKKDVGGIVGKFEPYVDTIYTTSKLQTLRDEMETLSDLTSNLTDTADGSNSLVHDSISQLGDSVEASKADLENVLDQGEEMVNANIDSANEISDTVAYTMDALVPITDSFDPVLDSLETSMSAIEEGMDYFEQASQELEGVSDILDEMSGYFEDAGDNLGDALGEIEDALILIENEDNGEDMGVHIQELGEHLADASTDLQTANDYLGDALGVAQTTSKELTSVIGTAQTEIKTLAYSLYVLSAQLERTSDAGADFDDVFSTLAGTMADVSDSLADLLVMLGSLEDMGDAVSGILTYIGYAQGSVDTALGSVTSAMGSISEIGEDVEGIAQTIQDVAGYLAEAVDDISDAKYEFSQGMDSAEELVDLLEVANDALGDGLGCLEDGFGYLEETTNNLQITQDLISDLVDNLSQRDEVEFTKFDEDFDTARDQLSASLDQMTADMEQLNDNIGDSADLLIDDAEAINQQFAIVSDLIIDILQDVSTFEIPTLIEDVSTTDTAEIYAGKVIDCNNIGTVEGDSNVGGIAGSITFEITLDDGEDWFSDTDKTQTITRQGIAVIDNTTSTGSVVAKKDNVGGIVGYQDFGLIQRCTAGAIVESTEGNYVGGIAGQSTGVIANCFSKTTLSGGQFVAGIAGFAYDVQGCYSLSAVTATKGGLGGIVGDLDVDGTLKNNYFVSDTLGGVDGISFQGMAETISYENLLQVAELPDLFQSMKLNFYVEDTLVDTLSVDFGAGISPEDFPTMAEKEGYFSRWEDVDTSAVTADLKIVGDYYLLLPTLSGAKNETGVATILVDGVFTELDTLMVEQSGTDYTIWVDGDNTAITRIRYLASAENVTIQLEQDGQWVDAEATVDGLYLHIPVDTNGTIHMRVITSDVSHIQQILIAVGLLALLAIGGIGLHKGKTKRKRKVTVIK